MSSEMLLPPRSGGKKCNVQVIKGALTTSEAEAFHYLIHDLTLSAYKVQRTLWDEFEIHLSQDTIAKHRRNGCASCKREAHNND